MSVRRSPAATAAVVLACLAAPSAAFAGAFDREIQPRPWQSVSDSSSTASAPEAGRAQFALEDPPSEAQGLPAAQENLELIGELNPQKFGGVRIGELADLTVHKGHAYLNSWDAEQCDRGGTYVVDIRNPAAPKEVAYIPPIQPFYHGEGAHAISVDVPGFKGDILAVNDEAWGSNVANDCGPADTSSGGFDLYDVSDPSNPEVLVQGAGDRDNDTPANPADDTALANSFHSVFIWQAGPRAYLAASDNVEFSDVDIFDVTDPRQPVQVGDHDLVDLFPEILDGEKANGANVFNHDMVVKQVNGRFLMNVSYWDAGYVTIDVTDPANPTLVTDTTNVNDAFRPNLFAEGNSHQSEFSFDNQFVLAADEDFSPFRSVLTSSATDKARTAIEGGDNPNRIADLPDQKLNGPSTWAGNGCEGAAFDSDAVGDPEFPPAPADDGDPNTDRIALVERGGPTITGSGGTSCGFAEKFDNAAAAGYDGIVIFNQVRPDDGQVNMNTTGVIGPPAPALIPGVQMRRVDAFGPEGALDPGTTTPASGTPGPTVSIGITFDGWGYTHLIDAETSEIIDSYAVPESQDPRFASDFGDLSVHEFATDPTESLAYSAYYGAGMRVFRYSRADGLVPTAKFIDDDGNGSNFWGVEQFTGSDGERYIAGSDRDFGLQIFKYTGPGAAKRPTCENVTERTTPGTPVAVALSCSDANGNPLSIRTVGAPSNGTLGAVVGGKVAFTPGAGFSGPATFQYVANDGAADSAPATATVNVAAAPAPTPTPTPGPGGSPYSPAPGTNGFTVRVGKYRAGKLPLRVTVGKNGRFTARLFGRVFRTAQARKRKNTRLARRSLRLTDGARTYRVVVRLGKKQRKMVKRTRARRAVKGSLRMTWDPSPGKKSSKTRRITIPKS